MPRYEPNDIDRIFRELDSETDRAAILIAGSLVEFALELAVCCRLQAPTTAREKEALANEDGMLGTFSRKIWTAYFLKVIGPEARRELDLIRQIRNRAAHDMNPVTFKTDEIAARCRELRFGADAMADGTTPNDERRRFLVIAAFFAANLLMRSGDSTAEIPPAFATSAPALNR
jgi:hypothetical protein